MGKLDRRQFLAMSSGAAAASMLHLPRAQAFSPSDTVGTPVSETDAATGGTTTIPPPPGPKVGYAIVGLGKFALQAILPAFAHCKHSKPVALVSGHPDKAEALAAAFNVPATNLYDYQSFDRMADNPDIQAVYIILPNAMHLEYTVRAAQAGKHVLCEKPLAISSGECREMIGACNSANRKLMTAYRCQYEPANLQMMAWGREQKFGPIQLINSDSNQDVGGAKQWRLDSALAGGGSLMDIGIYSLNAARYLTGEEPEVMGAVTYKNPNDERFRQVEQTIAFQLRFPSGAIANCSSSYSSASNKSYRVVGTQGWYGMDPATTYSGLRMFTSERGELPTPQINQFARMMDHFSECILKNKAPKTPGEEGLRDMEIIEKIYAAAK